jgi:hypothetical protein
MTVFEFVPDEKLIDPVGDVRVSVVGRDGEVWMV